ncbi:MAG: DUF6922 domain-containing protein [Bacteroidia bacterium]
MQLRRELFWDVNYDSIDWDEKFRFVIVRVFERGDVDDIRQVRRYYGDTLVKQALTETKYISKHRLYLAAAVINEPLEKFRCYILKQSSPPLFPY